MGARDRLQVLRERHAVTFQALRYAVAGLVITLLFSASYWAITEYLGLDPMISLTITFLFFTVVSFVTHGSYSFEGHGSRDRGHVRLARFLAVNLLGFAVNQAFVFVLVKQLGGQTWWPVIAFVFVTPLLTFTLHRRWVYA
jgi:putative flippase GtrA